MITASLFSVYKKDGNTSQNPPPRNSPTNVSRSTYTPQDLQKTDLNNNDKESEFLVLIREDKTKNKKEELIYLTSLKRLQIDTYETDGDGNFLSYEDEPPTKWLEGFFIDKWNNWLFYATESLENDTKVHKANYDINNYISDRNILIRAFNLETGNVKTIFDLRERINEFCANYRLVKEKAPCNAISQNNIRVNLGLYKVFYLRVINNTLFFTIAGDQNISSAMYWVDLPPNQKPEKLIDGEGGPRIEFWRDRYWIFDGDGDGCGTHRNYRLLDLNTKKVDYVATSSIGCDKGEVYIGFDKRGRMIFGYPEFSFDDYLNKEYKYVVAINLSSPPIREGVIAEQEMPPNIRSIVYLEGKDQLLLIGKENYIYDFSSKTLSKTNMTESSIKSRSEIPPEVTKEEENRILDQLLEKRIKSLNLPSNYKIERIKIKNN